ncbi:SDR family oxidoreductase [Streptomyces sp. NPDC127072]|uniref:SDR family oxidoreductase n=1 Tax=Streptomyces sp. NPDC127072 TaxID=3347129 RepID=UPI00364E6963
MPSTRVLVTGGSGFIAGHCIVQLLAAGFQVRTTIRSLTREASVRGVLAEAGMSDDRDLTFVAADLMRDEGWAQAVQDMDFVLHVASPVQPGHVENEDDVIVPAREGTLRVLRAARAAGVKRVVLTSAFHAVSWGHPHSDHVFTEEDWTVVDGPGVDAYGKSKTLAERAAWEYMRDGANSTELVTLLPVAVMGPVLGDHVSGANHVVQRMLRGAMPGFPHLFIPIVDVRDVAQAHVLAMTAPSAAGQRFLISNGPAIEMKRIGAMIKARLGADADGVPTRTLPNVAVRVAARFDPQLRAIVPDLGYAKRTSNEKARRVLGWTPRDPEEAVIAAAESLVKKGLIAR